VEGGTGRSTGVGQLMLAGENEEMLALCEKRRIECRDLLNELERWRRVLTRLAILFRLAARKWKR